MLYNCVTFSRKKNRYNKRLGELQYVCAYSNCWRKGEYSSKNELFYFSNEILILIQTKDS